MPVWSPDGNEIAFTTWDDKEGGAIYKVNLEGRKKITKLTQENGVYSYPVWNNEGSKIVFIKASENKEYKLDDGMCVISDQGGVLGLGGIIGGTRSGTELNTKNILLESAYFDPKITRKTAKKLELNSDAKFRFERGIDPNSISIGLEKASEMIAKICGGVVSKFDIQSTKKIEIKKILFDPSLASKTIGIQIKTNEIIKILQDLGFKIKKKGKTLSVEIPSWRPDINGQIDLVEEIIRIKEIGRASCRERV